MNERRTIRFMNDRFEHDVPSDSLDLMARAAWQSLENRRQESTDDGARNGPARDEPMPGFPVDMDKLRQHKIILAGAGRIGSRISWLLAPYRMKQMLMDYDRVELRNTIGDQTAFREEDVGKLKVYVQRDSVAASYPGTNVIAHPRNVLDVSRTEWERWADECALAIAAIDDGVALEYLNEVLYPRIPVFYPGLHRGGESGQIIVTRPGGSGCLKDCLGIQSGKEIETLHREPALGIHFGFVAHLTAQVVVQELAALDGSRLGRGVSPPASVILIGNMVSNLTPSGPAMRYWHVPRNPDCDVCGH